MAPPQLPETLSHTTTLLQSTARQGAQQPRKKVIEQAKDSSKSGYTDMFEDDEPEASQSTSDGALEQLMVNMVADQHERLAARKQDNNEDYIEKRAEIEDNINMTFEDYDRDISSAHQAQLKRLQDLLAQKASIEAAMAKQLVSLQKTYDAHSRDLETVLGRRLKDMN